MTQLRLYTTLGCHLCEQLETLLAQLHRGEYHLEKVEISDSEALMQRYGVRIPVLADEAGEELDQGFEPEKLADWLQARGWLDDAAWQCLLAGDGGLPTGRHGVGETSARPAGRRYLA